MSFSYGGLGLGIRYINLFVAGLGGDSPAASFRLQSNDGLWYDLSDSEISAGTAELSFGQTPQPAGTTPYRVIVNLTDGLKYKFRLNTDGVVTGGYDESGPTSEAETPTVFLDGSGRMYQLNFVTDGVITPRLDQV